MIGIIAIYQKEEANILSVMLNRFRKVNWKEYFPILLLFTISLVVGILIADDYGLSWDEYRDVTYGEKILNAYKGDITYRWEDTDRHHYGPFYWMSINLISNLVSSLQIDIQDIYIWKIVCFFSFLIGVLSFFFLCRRYISRIPALFTTVLFMTQPLLWGHAFINQKDIPFMSFFILCITLGLKGVDLFIQRGITTSEVKHSNNEGIRESWQTLRHGWEIASKSQKDRIRFIILLLIFLIIELLLLQKIVLPIMKTTVRNAYHGNSIPLINRWFEIIAEDAYKTPLDIYLHKIEIVYIRGSIFLIVVLALICYYLLRKVATGDRFLKNWRDNFKDLSFLLLPGIIFGLTLSIRIGGLFAGALISVYFLYKLFWKAVTPLIFYWCLAAGVSYATWPYLWGAPLSKLLESIQLTGSFASHDTLYQGRIHLSQNMPLNYLPFLMSVQFTIPAIVITILGIIVVIRKLRTYQVKWPDVLLFSAWVGIPFLAELIFRVPIYDNFRQLLFIIPPLFLFSGWGIDFLYERLRPNLLALAAILLLILPGITGLIKLHPYEYVYYNAFVGGVGGAYGKYELDYWCTSLREAMEFLNETAPPNSFVFVVGPLDAIKPFAREDLKVIDHISPVKERDFAIGCRYALRRKEFAPDFELIHTVAIDEGIFAIVKAKPSD